MVTKGKCDYCKDKAKFGGPGTKKQACIHRKCHKLIPPDRKRSLVSQAPPSPPPTKHQPHHTRALGGSSASSLGSSKLSRDVASVASLQEKEQALTALQGALGERERERDSLKEQVTELSRRLEDLQFQLEEQGVSRDQLETATEDSSKRLLELERADQEAGERTRALQGELLEKERQLTTQLLSDCKPRNVLVPRLRVLSAN